MQFKIFAFHANDLYFHSFETRKVCVVGSSFGSSLYILHSPDDRRWPVPDILPFSKEGRNDTLAGQKREREGGKVVTDASE